MSVRVLFLVSEWEKMRLDMAVRLSLADSEEQMERLQRSRAIVSRKLERLGLRRLDAVADGNCRFVALAYAAEIPISPQLLRAEVCQCLLKMEDTFRDWLNQCWNSFKEFLPPDCVGERGWGPCPTLADFFRPQ